MDTCQLNKCELMKLISTVRVKPDAAQMLKEKAFELSMQKGDFIKESDIVHYLIDRYTAEVTYDKSKGCLKTNTE